MSGQTPLQVVSDYMAAWNETGLARRQALLERCWGVDASYVDPTVELCGRDALSKHITGVQEKRPGTRLEFVSGVDVHHNVVRFLWRLVRADGSRGDISIDFGEIGEDGRLSKIVGFFGSAPDLETSG